MLLTLSDGGAYCRVVLEEIAPIGASLTMVTPGAGGDQGCMSMETVAGDERLPLLRLPKNSVSSVWTVNTGAKSIAVKAIGAGVPGLKPKSENATSRFYSQNAQEVLVQLQDLIVVNYGAVEIGEVEPPLSPTKLKKLEKLGMSISVDALPKDATLQIQLKNEYGQTASVKLALLPEARYSDSPTLQSLKIELASARKLAADERFMRTKAGEDGYLQSEEAGALRTLYDAALASLPNCGGGDSCDGMSKAQKATLSLVRADIDYRKFLLERRLTFWGGFRTLRPTTPQLELERIKSLRSRLEKANSEMEQLQFKTSDAAARLKELDGKKSYVLGQFKAEELTADVKTIDTNRWTQLKANNATARDFVTKEMTRVGQRMDALASQQDALGKQATSLAMNAAASATGMPVEVIAGVADGDLKKAVAAYVTSELANPGSALSVELKQFDDVMAEANKTFANLKNTYKEIGALKRDAELVAVSIREPSMERFMKVGELTYSRLSPEQAQKIDKIIDSQKPVQAWIQTAYQQFSANKKQLENYRNSLRTVAREMGDLPKAVNAEASTFFAQEFKRAKAEGDTAMQALMARTIDGVKDLQITGRQAEEALVTALKAYPNYISSVNTNLWYSLKARHPGINDGQLLSYFLNAANDTLSLSQVQREAYLKKTGMGLVADGTFVINVSGSLKTFDVNTQIIQLAKPINPSLIRLDAQAQIESLLSSVSVKASPDRLMSLVAASASEEGAGNFLSRFVNRNDSAKIWSKLKSLPPDFRNEVDKGVRYVAAASMAAPAVPRPEVPSVPDDPLIPSNSAQDQMQNQMAAMALNAAFPGAGTALQLAQTFGAMDANRQLNEQLSDQSQKLMSSYQELVRSSQDADFSEAISRKEYARATALADAAKAQLEQYNGAMDTILDTTQDIDARLRLYRPYFFYLAEMLRQRFDIFDRSLAMWSGATDSRGFFASKIATDPTLARLALDTEIHLFDWLNRDREATKTDPFLLFMHWQQLVQLAEDYCESHGCSPGDNRLGQIGTTSRVRAMENLAPPGTLQRFNQWKNSGSKQPFVFRVTLDPTSLREISEHRLNVRNLDWNAVPVTRNGRVAGSLLSVRHLGHSRIPYIDENGARGQIALREESMIPNSFMPSNRADTFDAAQLAVRFKDTTILSNLEGWGLYGAYELTIQASPAVKDVEDFEIELAYIYTDPENIDSERTFVSRSMATAIDACNTPETRGGAEAACRSIYFWSSNGCQGIPPSSSNRWLAADAGLEFLRVSQDDAKSSPMTLCKANAKVPPAKRAMDWQRATTQCSWMTAKADIEAMDRDGDAAKLQCKELAQ
ncbi:hypothetical protein CEJ42_05860 [Herbaspirillum robiniae]|uniref:Uncharacterized protein n=1 Tax=Herbaspirillum robiniae TaxID=2014887 RepID=A0A246WT91_9BURK|nr:hypothetical protein CEJ42_05860 [Herbaspirillum robiniae]